MRGLVLVGLFLVSLDCFAFTPWFLPRNPHASRLRRQTLLSLGDGRQKDYKTRNKTRNKRRRRDRDSYNGNKKQRQSSPEYKRALDSLLTDDNNHGIHIAAKLSWREQVHLIQELERSDRYNTILELVKAQNDTLQQGVLEAAIVALHHSSPSRWSQVFNLCKKHSILLSTNTCIKLFESVSSASEAATLMQDLQSLNRSTTTTVNVWNAALFACRRNNKNDNWQYSLHLLREMKRQGIIPNVKTYGHVLYTCAQSGQVRIALSLLEQVQQEEVNVTSPQIWGAALYACAKAVDYSAHEDALSILQHMQSQQIPINTIHVSAFLSTCAKAGKDNVAQDVLTCFRNDQEFHLNKLVIPSVSIDLVVVNTVLLACAKARNYTAAHDILQGLKRGDYANVEPDVISYNTVLSACTDPMQAKALVKEVRVYMCVTALFGMLEMMIKKSQVVIAHL